MSDNWGDHIAFFFTNLLIANAFVFNQKSKKANDGCGKVCRQGGISQARRKIKVSIFRCYAWGFVIFSFAYLLHVHIRKQKGKFIEKNPTTTNKTLEGTFPSQKIIFLKIILKKYNLIPACSIDIIPSVTGILSGLHTTLRLGVPFLCFTYW